MDTNCNHCKNYTKKLIDNKYCESYSDKELENCVEGFTSYQVELDKGKYKEIYDYNYEDDKLINDPELIEKTDIMPIMYMGDQPVVFINKTTNDKYYYDDDTKKLVKYKQDEKKNVNGYINYMNSLNVKQKLFHKKENVNKIEESEEAYDDIVVDSEAYDDIVVDSEAYDQVIHDDDEGKSNKKTPTFSNNVTNIMNKMDTSGFSKSFILSLIHELGSKEIKIKYIEDDRDDLTDDDFKKLNDIDNNTNNIEIVPEEPMTTTKPPVVPEEEEESVTTTTKKPCPLLDYSKCKHGYYEKRNISTGCKELKCKKKIELVEIVSYDISNQNKIIIYVSTIFFIILSIILIAKYM